MLKPVAAFRPLKQPLYDAPVLGSFENTEEQDEEIKRIVKYCARVKDRLVRTSEVMEVPDGAGDILFPAKDVVSFAAGCRLRGKSIPYPGIYVRVTGIHFRGNPIHISSDETFGARIEWPGYTGKVTSAVKYMTKDEF